MLYFMIDNSLQESFSGSIWFGITITSRVLTPALNCGSCSHRTALPRDAVSTVRCIAVELLS